MATHVEQVAVLGALRSGSGPREVLVEVVVVLDGGVSVGGGVGYLHGSHRSFR